MRTTRWSIPAVIVLLTVTGCGGVDPAVTTTPPATVASSAAPAAPAESAPTSVPPAATTVDKEIVVTVAGKKVTPPTGRIEVRRDAAVRITVTSDVADDLHVHGYDLTKRLPAGQPASIEFRTDRTGLFEVETHNTHLVLFQLVVR